MGVSRGPHGRVRPYVHGRAWTPTRAGLSAWHAICFDGGAVKRLLFLLIAACGGSPARPAAPAPEEPRLVPSVELGWYRARATCAQGPFEVEVPIGGSRYGESVDLEVHTTHAIALDAVVLVDGKELGRTHGTFAAEGRTQTAAANERCLADARERGALVTPGTGAPGTPGHPVVPEIPGTPDRGPGASTPSVPLEPIAGLVATSSDVLVVQIPPTGARRATVRFWSIAPNDLVDVAFGIGHVVMRPNVPEADYEAYLARERLREDELARERARVAVAAPSSLSAEELARQDRERRAAEAAAREAALRATREAALRAALEADRAARHLEFCNAHHEDRDCWGPGGFAGHAELELRRRERAAYCASAPEDARCWDAAEWTKRRAAWNARADHAAAPPPRPQGPPPAPLADPQPPQPSTHASWRPGYWDWTEGTWVWLAGTWRVPDEDIAAEQTATAPAAPPPPQVEAPPPPPVRAVVWAAGYWMWSSTSWVWIPGSYQLRPEPQVEWRAPAWRVRGAIHVLVPGGWVRR